MTDERTTAREMLGRLQIGTWRPLVMFCLSLLVAGAVTWLPEYPGLGVPGRHALFIVAFAAGLWLSEAIPAFAVALLVVALEILLLGSSGSDGDWQVFVAPWASPVIWLFFGGFVLAAAAVRSGLDRWLSGWVLGLTGPRPSRVLLGAMASTFVFSMFMSNTATATMMLSVLLPVIKDLDKGHPLRTALPLGIAFGANIGGMGTIIGSPPNAIAAGLLDGVDPVGFLQWSMMALPPAVLLAALTWAFLVWRYRADAAIDLGLLEVSAQPSLPLWQRLTIMLVFTVTIALWVSAPLYGLPTAVVSFLPIVALTVTRVIDSEDIRGLPWDVLLLVTGGLALGVGMEQTGLARYLVEQTPIDSLGPIALVLGLAWTCSLLSNFMSNTAATNILLPIAMAFTGGDAAYVMPIALAASSAMCMPVSTPPNALAASRAGLRSRDFLPGGVMVALLATPLSVMFCTLLLA